MRSLARDFFLYCGITFLVGCSSPTNYQGPADDSMQNEPKAVGDDRNHSTDDPCEIIDDEGDCVDESRSTDPIDPGPGDGNSNPAPSINVVFVEPNELTITIGAGRWQEGNRQLILEVCRPGGKCGFLSHTGVVGGPSGDHYSLLISFQDGYSDRRPIWNRDPRRGYNLEIPYFESDEDHVIKFPSENPKGVDPPRWTEDLQCGQSVIAAWFYGIERNGHSKSTELIPLCST